MSRVNKGKRCSTFSDLNLILRSRPTSDESYRVPNVGMLNWMNLCRNLLRHKSPLCSDWERAIWQTLYGSHFTFREKKMELLNYLHVSRKTYSKEALSLN
uniref:Uncharacterized protein n=1 Tax=Cacopsylla melanoneura TaxID=428564 RepID=A0A8D8UL70_9HEMI